MKKLSIFFIALAGSLLLFNSCGEIKTPQRYLAVNGEKIELKTASLTDYGTNFYITTREYDLDFATSDFNPSDFLHFTIYSTDLSELAEGVYTYSFGGEQPGTISYVSFGNNIGYDNSNQANSGTRIDDEAAVFSGTVTVSWENDRFYFYFDLVADFNGSTFHIQGEYNDVLTEYSQLD